MNTFYEVNITPIEPFYRWNSVLYYTRRLTSHVASQTSKVDYIKVLQKMFTFLLDPKIDDKIAEFSEKLNAFIYLLWYKVNVWFLSG